MTVTYVDEHLKASDRIEALRSTGLLDTPADPALDRLTKLVCSALHVPVALVSLVDSDRQFFASQCGLSEPMSTSRQGPLSHSYCKYVVHNAEPLIVTDAREHPLLRDNPAIKDNRAIAYAGVPLTDEIGNVLGSLCAVDSTPRRWSPQDIQLLRDLAVQAMVEVKLRAAALRLNEDLQQLQGVDADRREMLSATVHDLRTPLGGLTMSIDLFGRLGELNEAQQSVLELCKRNSVSLRRMVDDLVDISAIDRAGATALERREIDVHAIVEQALADVRQTAAEKGITLSNDSPDADRPMLAQLDAQKVRRLAVNLLNGAIKYTADGGSVAIEADRDVPGYVRISITDSGTLVTDETIADEEHARITARRWRGLDMTFCKRVVDAHGGRLWFEAGTDGSTTFNVSLPNREPANGSAGTD